MSFNNDFSNIIDVLTDLWAGLITKIGVLSIDVRASAVVFDVADVTVGVSLLVDVGIIIVVIALEFAATSSYAVGILADVGAGAVDISIGVRVEVVVDMWIDVLSDMLATVLIGAAVATIGAGVLVDANADGLKAVMTVLDFTLPASSEESLFFC